MNDNKRMHSLGLYTKAELHLVNALLRLTAGFGLLIDLLGNLLQRLLGPLCIQGLLLILPKDAGEELWQDSAQNLVGIFAE